MTHCFEKYEFNNKGRIFNGYIGVDADNDQQAAELAQQLAGEHIKLQAIYISADPYSR